MVLDFGKEKQCPFSDYCKKKTNSELDFTQKPPLSFQWDDPPS